MTDDGAHSGHGHSHVRKHGAHHHKSGSKSQMPSHPHLHQPTHSSVSDSRRQLVHSGVVIDNRDNLPKYPSGVVKGARVPNRQAEVKRRSITAILFIIL